MYEEFKTQLDKSENILIISHKKPDCDTIGANCGLSLALLAEGKKVQRYFIYNKEE